MHDAAYARANGEIDQYRSSRRANIDCKNAIENAVRDNFDGMHLSQDAAKGVIEQYGAERVAHVLAATVCHLDWDGRFSRDTKEWAKTVPTVKDMDAFGNDRSTEYVVESHPAVLNGFIKLARKEIDQVRGEPEKSADRARPSALEQLKSSKDGPDVKPKATTKQHQEVR